MTNIGETLVASVNEGLVAIVGFVPKFVLGFVILLVGIIIASILKQVVLELFKALRVEAFLKKYGVPEAKDEFSWSGILAEIVRWFIIIVFLLPTADIWGLPRVDTVLNQVILYLPNVFVAVILTLVGFVFARLAHDVILASTKGVSPETSRTVASITRWAISVFVILAALNQLGVASDLVRILFTGFVAMLAIAGGIAFGLGGQGSAKDIVEGIRNKTTQSFREKYRKLSILLIDDIQFIAGKDAVQEEFFHTFNAVTGAGGQIILTSDRHPSEISKLEERLRSRFEAGLIVDVAPPDFELRCAIMQIKCKEKGMALPMDLIQIIAGNVDSARKIEGFLIRLASHARMRKEEIGEELVRSLLGKGVEEPLTKKASPADVFTAVAKYFSVGKRSLLGPSRTRPIARPRQILMYLLRRELGLPLEEVGRLVGGRDHTTVMHAVEKITSLASNNVQIREDLLGIKKRL